MSRRRSLAAFLSALIALGLVQVGRAAPAPAATSGSQQGVDVSSFQNSINWSQVAASGVSFAYLRAAYGANVPDVDFRANWNGAVGSGVTPGAYLFFCPDEDPSAQANLLVSQLQAVTFARGDILPAVDVEQTAGCDSSSQIPASTIVANLHVFVDAVQSALGVLPAVYTAPLWWDSHIGSSDFTGDPLWVADWCGSCTSPSTPASNWGGHGWEAWQYSDSGTVPGISGNVDLDQGSPGPPLYSALPTVSAVSPQSGLIAGGTQVSMTGSAFIGAVSVQLGSASVSATCDNSSPPSNEPCFAVNSATSITVYTPSVPAPEQVGVTVTTPSGTSASSAAGIYDYVTPSAFTPLSPYRILDTRAASCVRCGGLGAIPSGTARTVQVSGVGGAQGQSVPASALAVVLNVTATHVSAPSYVTLYPAGASRPLASNLNVNPGDTVPNLVVVALSSGAIDVYNAEGDVDIIIDVAGYFAPPAGTPVPGLFHPIAPVRVCDTRAGTATACSGTASDNELTAGSARKVAITGLPAGAAAVVVNLTGTEASEGTFLSVFPPDSGDSCAYDTPPPFSNLNLIAGSNRPNRVVVPLGPAQDVCVYNAVGAVDFIIDLNGWFGNGAETSAGSYFYSITPSRVCDTRSGNPTACSGHPVVKGGVLDLTVASTAGVPPAGSSPAPDAVVANVTATDVTTPTFVALYSTDETRPTVSDLNPAPGGGTPNLVVVMLSASGSTPGALALYNDQGSIDAVIDIAGWFQT